MMIFRYFFWTDYMDPVSTPPNYRFKIMHSNWKNCSNYKDVYWFNLKPANKICLCYTLFACFYTTIRSVLFTCFHPENRKSSQFHNCIWEVSKLLQLPSPHQLLWPSFCKVIRILGLLLSTLHNLCSINVTECLYE